jgi:APA family basic amino acid/polyamine antiporter
MNTSSNGLLRHFRLRSATALVIANIIGAGIFTSTGFQAADLGHTGFIFLLWIVGGVLAFCGALCFAELGTAMPKAGGEYVYLRETFGPAPAFMSAFVSLTAGFSAPIASACKAFASYSAALLPENMAHWPEWMPVSGVNVAALTVAWTLVFVHCRGVRRGVAFNDLVTVFKVGGIVLIIVAAFTIGKGSASNLISTSQVYASSTATDLGKGFGTSLIFVGFCYSGWNAAAYVAGEMNDPQRDLPRALLVGTGVVVLLYLGLNAVYFYGASLEELSGEVEVGLIASRNLFGEQGAMLVTLVLCVSILASASAMTIAGARIYYAFGRDNPSLSFLGNAGSKSGAPTAAILLQGVVTSIIILSGRIDQIQQYAGFTITLFGSLAVLCVIVLRFKRPEMPRPFKTWGYPVTPILFLVLAGITMTWAMGGRPLESTLGLATVAIGGVIFYVMAGRKSSSAPADL